MLEKLGSKVSIAWNGIEALDALRQQRGVLYSDVPVLAMTANALSGDRNRCLAAGMTEYLAKPIDPVQLRDTLSRMLRSGPPIPSAMAPATHAMTEPALDLEILRNMVGDDPQFIAHQLKGSRPDCVPGR